MVETLISLLLSTLLLTGSLWLLNAVWDGYRAMDERSQTLTGEIVCRRMVLQDIHQSASAYLIGTTLQLNLADGTSYQYYVNVDRQYVRVQLGGGTSVLAVQVQAVQAVLNGNQITVNVRYKDGREDAIIGSTLQGV